MPPKMDAQQKASLRKYPNIPDFTDDVEANIFIASNVEKAMLVFRAQALVSVASGNDMIDRMAGAGASIDEIIAALRNDWDTGGPVFGGLRTTVFGTTRDGANQVYDAVKVATDARRETAYADTALTWIAVLDENTCNTCESMHGETAPAVEWVGRGPRELPTECDGHCRCELVQLDMVASNLMEAEQ